MDKDKEPKQLGKGKGAGKGKERESDDEQEKERGCGGGEEVEEHENPCPQPTPVLARNSEGPNVLLLNAEDVLQDKCNRRWRNLLRRSSVVGQSQQKECWAEAVPHRRGSNAGLRSSTGGLTSRGSYNEEQPEGVGGGSATASPASARPHQRRGSVPSSPLPNSPVYPSATMQNEMKKELEHDIYNCLAAKTALIVPFFWGETFKSATFWTEKMLKRHIVDNETGKRVPLWEIDYHLPFETAELSAHFRQIVGWNEAVRRFMHEEAERMARDAREKAIAIGKAAAGLGNVDLDPNSSTATDGDDGEDAQVITEPEPDDDVEHNGTAQQLQVWKCQRMKLTKHALKILFPHTCVWASGCENVAAMDTFGNNFGQTYRDLREAVLASAVRDIKHHPMFAGTEPEAVPSPPHTPIPEHPLHSHTVYPNEDTTSSEEEDAAGVGPEEGLKKEMRKKRITAEKLKQALNMSAGPDVHQSGEKKIGFDIGINSVDLILYPLGTGLLVFQIEWIPDRLRDIALTLDELRTWLFLIKFRNKVRKVFLGWTLGEDTHCARHRDDPRAEQASKKKRGAKGGTSAKKPKLHRPEHLQSLGRLAHSIHGSPTNNEAEELVSLCTIGNWLLHLPNEDPASPPRRIVQGAYASHHTTVVLDREPEEQDLQEYLFHLTRAFGQRNRPPPPTATPKRLDQVLVHRLNRYIGVSREGTVALSWPTDNTNIHFERRTWPKLFQGIYLILCLHARGESVVLAELSNLSAHAAEHLRLDAGDNLDKLERNRQELRYLAALMIQYSLGMSSDDCGGLSEYSHFFSTMRRMLGIPETRQEIRDEIHDVLGIVESGYLEEQRRQIREEKRVARARELAQYRADRAKDARKKRIETAISVVGAFTLPFMLISGVFGMNLGDLPDFAFWPVMLCTLCMSLMLILALLFWFSRPTRMLKKSDFLKQFHINEQALSTSATQPPPPPIHIHPPSVQFHPSASSSDTLHPSSAAGGRSKRRFLRSLSTHLPFGIGTGFTSDSTHHSPSDETVVLLGNGTGPVGSGVTSPVAPRRSSPPNFPYYV